MQKSSKTVILSVINDISTDQRVHRIASTLSDWGFEVLVVGRKLPNSPPLPVHPYQTHRLRCFWHKGKLFYLEFTLRLFFFLLFRRADVYTANDLDTLLPNYLIARFKHKRLVYDAHELFTEVPELIHRPFTRKIWLILEQWLMPHVDNFMTVNEGLAEVYQERYAKTAVIVRNVPFYKQINDYTHKQPILIYQGALNVGRGIELMIETMILLPEYQLWIIGDGDIKNHLHLLAREKNVSNQLRFFGKLPFSELHALTTQARIGFSLEEDLGANYRLATPNKIYDYIQAEIPVIVSDLPLMKQIVQKWRVGHVLIARSPEKLAELVHKTVEVDWNMSLKKAKAELCWENEREKLKLLYYK